MSSDKRKHPQFVIYVYFRIVSANGSLLNKPQTII